MRQSIFFICILIFILSDLTAQNRPATQQELENGEKGIVHIADNDIEQAVAFLDELSDSFFVATVCNGFMFHMTDEQINKLKKSKFRSVIFYKNKIHEINAYDFSHVATYDVYILSNATLNELNENILTTLIPDWKNETILNSDYFLINKNQFDILEKMFELKINKELIIDKDKTIWIIDVLSSKKKE